MKSLQNKTKLLIVLSLVAGLTFQCEKKEEEDMTPLLALAALTTSAGDCSVSTAGKSTINTWTTDVTGTTSGTISKLGSVPIVAHSTAAIKLTADGTTSLAVTGSAFIIVYKTSACPLATSNLAVRTTDYSITGGADSASEFPESWKITNQTATITLNGSNGYYVFLYAIPRNGQSAGVTYTFNQ
ncbi:hypothetical protein JWG40_14085 [Leptospira sp. 201903074]|uniref:LIC20153 family lipoprotein n=1 Tax=Leptospira abararensis TaxID=2810036 RepID=UPI001965649B|nr:hypothetical protein [Leptospira abararensis]MBM9548156.1 hypothetical protein [Leptospira abararensis]